LTLKIPGTVTIGPSSFNAALTVSRNSGVNTTAYLLGTTHHSAFNFGTAENTYIRAGKDGGTVFINDIPGSKIAISGYVGINTATPAFPLEIRRGVGNHILSLVDPNTFNNWNFDVGNLHGSLYLRMNGIGQGYFEATDGSYVTYSDKRLKTNITALPSLLKPFMQLQPVSFEMTHDNPQHKQTIGLIAQDVKRLFPELVTVSTDTTHGYKGISDLHVIDYNGFSILAIKVIQEQQQIIKKQEQSVAVMRTRLEKLKKTVGQFQKQL
jgi:hypothetical protein